MRHGSLFSGIGGFDLAAQWMGWENVFHCEINPFGQKVLKYYFPEAESFTDITKTDFTKYANKIDILTGGFPCQPYSSAGKRLGKADERHLWPEMLRAICEIKPTYIVGENVRGLLNWNGGLVFEEVCAELEDIGYQVAPSVIPACGVGSPHRRERIWIVAYSDSNGQHKRNIVNEVQSIKRGFNAQRNSYECSNDGTTPNTDGEGTREQPSKSQGWNNRRSHNDGKVWDATDTKCDGLEHWDKARNIQSQKRQTCFEGSESTHVIETNGSEYGWENFPSVTPLCYGNDGISDRLDGITFSKWRNESIKGGGNAIVPQVAFQIFKTIQKLNNDLHPM